MTPAFAKPTARQANGREWGNRSGGMGDGSRVDSQLTTLNRLDAKSSGKSLVRPELLRPSVPKISINSQRSAYTTLTLLKFGAAPLS